MLQPGTLSVQVAHDQQSAEEIFRIVHRFLENLPEAWRQQRAEDLARQRPPDHLSPSWTANIAWKVRRTAVPAAG